MTLQEKVVPDLEFFKNEILEESNADFFTQKLKIAERLINFPAEEISELHLQDWYSVYWKFLNLSQYTDAPTAQVETVCSQLKGFVDRYEDPVRRQYFALVYLFFGKMQEFQELVNFSLWSRDMLEDFNAYSKLSKLIDLSSNLTVRGYVRHNRQLQEFLQEKYSDLIKKYSQAAEMPKVAQEDYQIYFCWLQGEENMPPLVRCCYGSLKQNAGAYKVVFIDEKNYAEYVEIPEQVSKKYGEGKISHSHFSDILRVNLLERYGGLWLDSTVLVTEPLERYKQYWKLRYYTQKFYQTKSNFSEFADNPSYGRWATFIQGAAVLHNPLFGLVKDFYNEYWQEYDEVIDYVLTDFAIEMAYETLPAVKDEIDAVPINNNRAWDLLGILSSPYSEYPYDKIFQGNFLNKLNRKKQLDWQRSGTVLKEIQKRYAPETLGG